MIAFTIITGIVTLFGFLIQIKDLFPHYRRYFSAVTLILLGVTAGLLIQTASQITFHLQYSLTLTNIVGLGLCAGSGLIILVSFLASVVIDDKERRAEASKIGSAVSGFLIFLLLFFFSFFFSSAPPRDSFSLTYDEQIECALNAFDKKNYERSLTLLGVTMESLPANDHRKEGLMQLLQKVREEQAKIPSKALNISDSSADIPVLK